MSYQILIRSFSLILQVVPKYIDVFFIWLDIEHFSSEKFLTPTGNDETECLKYIRITDPFLQISKESELMIDLITECSYFSRQFSQIIKSIRLKIQTKPDRIFTKRKISCNYYHYLSQETMISVFLYFLIGTV